MSEIDYVIPVNQALKITYNSVFDMHELYRHIRSWLDKNGYVTFEKEYRDWMKESGKSASIKLAPWKKIDDYTKFLIEISIKFKDLKEVETKNGIMNKGEVTIVIISYIQTDYEDRWETNFMRRFIRALNDHFFGGEKTEANKKELQDETFEFYNEIKAFLGLQRTAIPKELMS